MSADEIRRIRDSVKYIKHVPEGWRDGVIASHVEALRGRVDGVDGAGSRDSSCEFWDP